LFLFCMITFQGNILFIFLSFSVIIDLIILSFFIQPFFQSQYTVEIVSYKPGTLPDCGCVQDG
jgi:hypothetical protein